ncbi:hypothetical protein [Rummeliibacillus sp. POC4]|uniref:hypothetical protein n=1 Tax=Rummeliibacillus sp. POC4 TaxID=2305899 RepID=UPI0011C3EB31|nr:hypothetical protein [Rummeliibacillus sp. POC4]
MVLFTSKDDPGSIGAIDCLDSVDLASTDYLGSSVGPASTDCLGSADLNSIDYSGFVDPVSIGYLGNVDLGSIGCSGFVEFGTVYYLVATDPLNANLSLYSICPLSATDSIDTQDSYFQIHRKVEPFFLSFAC